MALSVFKCLSLKQFSGYLLAGILALSLVANGADTNPQLSSNNNISSADKIALTLINKLPDSGTKSGLQRYYSILSLKHYSDDSQVALSNSGIALFFEQHFQQNACFSEKAYLFYRDLRRSTRQQQTHAGDSSRHRRPSLGDVAGKNRKDLKPGWLYERALQFSGGSPNAAISLIGLCGHDDKNQGDFKNFEIENKLINSGAPSDEFYSLKDGSQGDAGETTLCPSQYADFYVAGGLSKSSDISDGLKQKILTTQYPGKNALQIASKNYHVLGAAFMTCQMIEAGLNPLLAVKVESMAASLYRGIRLCQKIETPANIFWNLQREKEIARRPLGTTFETAVIEKALQRGREKSCSLQKIRTDSLCKLLHTVGAPFDLTVPRIEARARALLEKYMDELVASGLYASWHISGEVAGISLPCSRDQLWGPHPFLQWLINKTEVSLNICGHGLTMDSCRKAVRTVKSWETDFDWTVSQHAAGARFAARVCKSYPEGQSSFTEFCKK